MEQAYGDIKFGFSNVNPSSLASSKVVGFEAENVPASVPDSEIDLKAMNVIKGVNVLLNVHHAQTVMMLEGIMRRPRFTAPCRDNNPTIDIWKTIRPRKTR